MFWCFLHFHHQVGDGTLTTVPYCPFQQSSVLLPAAFLNKSSFLVCKNQLHVCAVCRDCVIEQKIESGGVWSSKSERKSGK